jgi:hypothetical protein
LFESFWIDQLRQYNLVLLKTLAKCSHVSVLCQQFVDGLKGRFECVVREDSVFFGLDRAFQFFERSDLLLLPGDP